MLTSLSATIGPGQRDCVAPRSGRQCCGATLDAASGGRLLVTFVPGLAYGPERDATGVPVRERADAIET
jgi:hypothetical protein